MDLDLLFRQHPRSLGESYLEHQRQALSFGGTLILAGVACVVHALVPALFATTASRRVARLQQQMIRRAAPAAAAPPGIAASIPETAFPASGN